MRPTLGAGCTALTLGLASLWCPTDSEQAHAAGRRWVAGRFPFYSKQYTPVRHSGDRPSHHIPTLCTQCSSCKRRRWVDEGKTVDARDNTQKTPLHYAAQWGQEEALDFLIECGAKVNATDFIDDTPLHFVSITTCCRKRRTHPLQQQLFIRVLLSRLSYSRHQ